MLACLIIKQALGSFNGLVDHFLSLFLAGATYNPYVPRRQPLQLLEEPDPALRW